MAPVEPAAFAGTYHSAELDAAWTVMARDGGLVLSRRAAPELALRHVRGDDFTAAGLELRFIRTGGRVDALVVQAGRVRNIRFARVR
jgi:hypothetical protein